MDAAAQAPVTVIVPTTCEARRAAELQRAIASLQAQPEVEVLVLINGSRFDPGLRAKLEVRAARGELRVHYQATGSLPLALRTGREQVHSPFFGFLDDDDEYLPGTVAARMAPLQADGGLAFSVCNGFKRSSSGEQRVIRDLEAVRRDPLGALAQGNWLASCGGLYRSAAVQPEDFDPGVKHLEWTYVAYRLASRLRLAVVAEPGYRIHETPGSLSLSTAYREGLVQALRSILALSGLPATARRDVRKRLADAHHDLSVAELAQGNRRAAWRHHLASLRDPQGWAYLPYTRRLF